MRLCLSAECPRIRRLVQSAIVYQSQSDSPYHTPVPCRSPTPEYSKQINFIHPFIHFHPLHPIHTPPIQDKAKPSQSYGTAPLRKYRLTRSAFSSILPDSHSHSCSSPNHRNHLLFIQDYPIYHHFFSTYTQHDTTSHDAC